MLGSFSHGKGRQVREVCRRVQCALRSRVRQERHANHGKSVLTSSARCACSARYELGR